MYFLHVFFVRRGVLGALRVVEGDLGGVGGVALIDCICGETTGVVGVIKGVLGVIRGVFGFCKGILGYEYCEGKVPPGRDPITLLDSSWMVPAPIS